MKPNEGRKRIVIEEIQPSVNGGRYPAKRVLGDIVEVTAAIFGDGHDHIAARLLYRHTSQRKWQTARFTALSNDLWTASFPVGSPGETDKLGAWRFTIEAWVDHFDTWNHDLAKRLAAQPATTHGGDQAHSGDQAKSSQDIPLALRIGANHLDAAASRAKATDAKKLKLAANNLRSLADANHPFYDSPVTPELIHLAARYPDLAFATTHSPELPLWVDRERARFSSWYELFPRSAAVPAANGETPAANGDTPAADQDQPPAQHGTLRDVEARLPEIASMGFDVLYMPPIHPIGAAFRKGMNNSVTAEPGDVGSPWAIGSKEGGHTAILPELGTFDDFDSLVRAAQTHGLDIALDIAFQCSPDHPWVTEHPSWFTHRPDGTIQYAENPPKKYQDIYPLNFETSDWRGLWDGLHGVFKFWIARGVRVFRVDNPHTKALPFWEWCISEVLKSHPDTIFLAEAFTRPHVMYALAKGGFTQSYTYFTWRTTKAEIEEYFTEICNPPVSDFFRPNVWPNTPDILHEQFQVEALSARRAIFRQRVILAATLSANYGIYGPAYELLEGRPAKPSLGKTGSEEYLNSEKYQIRAWDRSSPDSIAPLITELNRIRHENPALQRNENLHFHTCENPQILCYSKSFGSELSPGRANTILVAVNLDPGNQQTTWVNLALDELDIPWGTTFAVDDLLTGTRYTWSGQWNYVALTPDATAHIFRIVRTG